jgi:hypothetical protein
MQLHGFYLPYPHDRSTKSGRHSISITQMNEIFDFLLRSLCSVSQHRMQMIARRRARAMRALRIVDRLAIAKAQSFSLSYPLKWVSMTLAASYRRVRTRRSPHFEMPPR